MKKKGIFICLISFLIIMVMIFGLLKNNPKIIIVDNTNGKNYNASKKNIFGENNNISIENRLDKKQLVYFYDGKKWSKKMSKSIYGLKIYNSKSFLNKYNLCYRTYNKKNKWLNWTCSDDFIKISGNKKFKIEGIQIKIFPYNSNKYDYLDDLYENSNLSNYNFK